MRRSAPATRPPRPEATSSTQSRSCTNASWSEAAWAARSVSSPPRMVRCAARSRRSFNASTITHTRAIAPTPAAARATIPWVEFRSSTAARVLVASAREDDRELGLVVVRDLLARHRLHPHGDGDVLPGWRLLGEGDRHVLCLAGGDLGDRVLELDHVAALPDGHLHLHVRLGAVPLVHHLDDECNVT